MIIFQFDKKKFDELSQVIGLLDNILDKLSIGKGELAALLQIDPATLSRIYKGKQPATEAFLLTACLLLENIEMNGRLDEIDKAHRIISGNISRNVKYSTLEGQTFGQNNDKPNSGDLSSLPPAKLAEVLQLVQDEAARRGLSTSKRRRQAPKQKPSPEAV